MARLRDSGHGYDFLPAAGRYSAAVVAQPGFMVHRVRLVSPVAHDLAFELIGAHLGSLGLPGPALCALELRSPKQFTEQAFADYNGRYQHALEQLGIVIRGNANPIARSNLCPASDPPPDVSVHAFSYVAPVVDRDPGGLAPLAGTFVIAGSAEVPEDRANFGDHIVARGDLGPEGMTRKIRWVVGEMGRRLRAVHAEWADVTDVQAYSVRDVGALLAGEVQQVTGRPVTWHACLPPVVELEFEMDTRRVGSELVLDPAVS